MFCNNCGQENPGGSVFCNYCSARLPSPADSREAVSGEPVSPIAPTGPSARFGPPVNTFRQSNSGPQPGGPPPFGQFHQGPPPGTPYCPPYYTPGHQETDIFAIASLALGVSGFFMSFLMVITSILAVIFGYHSRNKIRNSDGRLGGDGLALAGIIIGWIEIGLIISGILILLLALASGLFDNIDIALYQLRTAFLIA